MRLRFLSLILCIFLAGCSSHFQENENKLNLTIQSTSKKAAHTLIELHPPKDFYFNVEAPYKIDPPHSSVLSYDAKKLTVKIPAFQQNWGVELYLCDHKRTVCILKKQKFSL